MNIEILDEVSAEIGEYNPVAAGLAELKRKYGNVAVSVASPKDLEEAKRVRAEIREPRYECEKIRKALKAPALAHAKLIDTEAARITAELVALETPWDEAIKSEEARKEAEKQAREAAERARVMAITERIAGIRQYVELVASCRTSERMQALQDKLAEIKIEGFEEYEEEALQVVKQTCTKVDELLNAKLEQEAEQERIKSEQCEAAFQLAKEREAFAEQQAAAKVEADRLASERLAQIAEEVQFQAIKRKAEQDELAAQRAAFESEAAEARAIVAENKARIEQQQAADAAMAATHEEEVKQEAEPAPAEDKGPSDAECMWVAISAVSQAYGMTTEQATARLAAVQWTI